MSVKSITTDDLRRMKDSGGLILQGCGGDLQEWVDGINETLTKEGIILDGTKFENCSSFQHNNMTCMLFPFDGLKIDGGRFNVWRIKTNEVFGSTWLSDFVDNSLGGYIDEDATEEQTQSKPDCPLIGQDSNIFNLMGIAFRTLKDNGMDEKAKEMRERITGEAGSYGEALNIIGEYVNITSIDDAEDETEDYEEGMNMGL